MILARPKLKAATWHWNLAALLEVASNLDHAAAAGGTAGIH